jgi:hypothetical protein
LIKSYSANCTDWERIFAVLNWFKQAKRNIQSTVFMALRRPPPEYASFREWTNVSPTPKNEILDFETWRRQADDQVRSLNSEDQNGRYRTYVADELRKKDVYHVLTIDEQLVQFFPLEGLKFNYLGITLSSQKDARIKNCEIFHLRAGREKLNIIIESARVQQLRIEPESDSAFSLSNVWLGNVSFQRRSVKRWSMSGGAILSAECNGESGNNPFDGDVSLRRVFVPRTARQGSMNIQRLRDLRMHLTARGNQLAAGVFHSAELALERPNEGRLNRIWSWIYDVMADYGNSTVRPLVSLAVFWTAIFGLAAIFDAIAVAADTETLKGWYLSLSQEGRLARVYRAATFAFHSVANPLGWFGTRTVLVATNIWGSVVFAILGAFGTLSLAFLAIALRRRFRLA